MISSQSYSASIVERRGEPCLYGRSSTQQSRLMPEITKPESNLRRPGFATIDDMLDLARELVDGLNQLGERRHPLDIRRGVRNMVERKENESEMLKASGKTFFFDIKETREKKPYLVITESRLKGEGEKPERNSIMIFQESLDEFAEVVAKMAKKIAPSK